MDKHILAKKKCLERILERFVQGEDVEYIRLRKTDELEELAARINDLMRMIRESRS